MSKPKLTPNSQAWPKAIEFLKTPAGTIDAIRTRYDLNKADEATLKASVL